MTESEFANKTTQQKQLEAMQKGSQNLQSFINLLKTKSAIANFDTPAQEEPEITIFDLFTIIDTVYYTEDGENRRFLSDEYSNDLFYILAMIDCYDERWSKEKKDSYKSELQKLASVSSYKEFSHPEDYFTYFREYDDTKCFRPSFFSGIKFRLGTMNYIAARPSRGKTTLMINLMLDAIEQGKNAIFLNGEITVPQLYLKIHQSMIYRAMKKENPKADFTQYEKWDMEQRAENIFKGIQDLTAEKNQDYIRHFKEQQQKLSELDQSGRMKIMDVSQKTKAEIIKLMQKEARDTVIFLDYLQLVKFGQNEIIDSYNRYQLVALLSHDLTNLAKEKNFIFIAGCQMNKEGAGSSDFDKPENLRQTSMREADDILMDANIIISLGKETPKDYFWKILKNRDGKNSFESYYFKTNMQFSFMESTEEKVTTEDQKKKKTDKTSEKKNEVPHGKYYGTSAT